MAEAENYNALLSICLGISPPQNDLVDAGRRLVSYMECRIEVSRKIKKAANLILLSDVILITQVEARVGCHVEYTFALLKANGAANRSVGN